MPETSTQGQPLLSVTDLNVSFFTDRGELRVVQEVTFSIRPGETVALVGESGCGKTVTALAVMGLLEHPGRITRGSIRLKGQELVGLPEKAMEELRGKRIGMIFQEPMTSLNPVFTVGDQISEVLTRHFNTGKDTAHKEALHLLQKVGIPSPEQRIDQYPHELSGGMKQRVMIAMALACQPDLLIADEPTTALDVTIQSQILHLLKQLQKEMGMSILLITHNLGIVAHFVQRVVVMYAGKVAERAGVRTLFKDPKHPYTQALLAALPAAGHTGRLQSIQGTVPTPLEYPTGCRFSTRCPAVMPQCIQEDPPLTEQYPGHDVACWLYERPSKP